MVVVFADKTLPFYVAGNKDAGIPATLRTSMVFTTQIEAENFLKYQETEEIMFHRAMNGVDE